MNRKILRSVAAILLGWAAQGTSCFGVIFAILIFYREPTKPDVPFSLGWLLVNLLVGFVCSVMGGFVTGVVAQRREIAHALGLIVFMLLVSVGFLGVEGNTKPSPAWYVIAGHVAVVPSALLGGWLSRKQRILPGMRPAGPFGATDRVRTLTAIFVAFGTFVFVLYLTGALGILGLMPILGRLFGEQHPGNGILPCFLALLLSGFLARYVFKKIIRGHA